MWCQENQNIQLTVGNRSLATSMQVLQALDFFTSMYMWKSWSRGHILHLKILDKKAQEQTRQEWI